MIETGCALILVAICCTIACIVGGNVSLPTGVQFGQLSKPTRVVLGLFASFSGLVGVILLLMGLAMPSGPSPEPEPTPPSPTASESDDWAGYAQTTNGKCRQLTAQESQIAWPDNNASMSDFADAYRQHLRLMDAGLATLRVTRVPAAYHATMVEVWDQFQAIVEAEEQLVTGLTNEDAENVSTARDQYLDAADGFNRSARAVGLSDCVFQQ